MHTIYTIANYFRYMIQIEVFDATNKTTFFIFDRDAEEILNKFAKDIAKKQSEVQLILIIILL